MSNESDCDDDGDVRSSDDDLANSISNESSLHRKKKTRTVFSRQQVSQLEMTFDMKRYLSSQERSHLAATLRLTETQVFLSFLQSVALSAKKEKVASLSVKYNLKMTITGKNLVSKSKK